MGLFRKQKKETASPLKQMVSGKASTLYNKLKSAWANWMALRAAKLTKKGLIAALACFVLLTGSYSGYLIVSAFTGAPATAINVGSIRKPAHTGNTGEARTQALISKAELNRIEKFHRFMDSLARDPTGKRVYDSITSKRPGLMDSVIQVEKYYQDKNSKP